MVAFNRPVAVEGIGENGHCRSALGHTGAEAPHSPAGMRALGPRAVPGFCAPFSSRAGGCTDGTLVEGPSVRYEASVADALQGHVPEQLHASLGLDLGQLRRLVASVHQRGLSELSPPAKLPPQVSRRVVEGLGTLGRVGALRVTQRLNSALDPFEKFVLVAEDGHRIETVKIPLEKPGRIGVCVSSQVGCAQGCTFCRTARSGCLRSLLAWELVEQVRVVRQTLGPGQRVSSVVFQGMGEPLANLREVAAAIAVLSHPAGQAVDQRGITVCTAGLTGKIRELLGFGFRVRLGLSLGSARSEIRARLMPLERRHPLLGLLPEVIEFSRTTGYAPMLAITLLSGINTTDEEAHALINLIHHLGDGIGRMPRLSLVTYNPIGEDDPYQPASSQEFERFRDRLMQGGFPVVRRYSGGSDIGAACGQLAADSKG